MKDLLNCWQIGTIISCMIAATRTRLEDSGLDSKKREFLKRRLHLFLLKEMDTAYWNGADSLFANIYKSIPEDE